MLCFAPVCSPFLSLCAACALRGCNVLRLDLCHTGGPSALLASIVHIAFSLLYVPVWRHSHALLACRSVRVCAFCSSSLQSLHIMYNYSSRPRRPRFARRSRAQASVYDRPLAPRPSAVPLPPVRVLHDLYFLPFLAVSLVMLCLLFSPAALLPASWFPMIAFQLYLLPVSARCLYLVLPFSIVLLT